MDYTINEIIMIIEVNNQKEKEELKLQATFSYNQALLTTNLISQVLGGSKVKPPSLHEIYPYLFEEEKKQDWRVAKANMIKFSQAHNRKRGESKN